MQLDHGGQRCSAEAAEELGEALGAAADLLCLLVAGGSQK